MYQLFVIIFRKEGSNLNRQISSMCYQHNLALCAKLLAGIAWFALMSGCAASKSPLSISLSHPKTGVQRTCSARESSSSDIAALSSAVEACVKQLEARGFVRTD
jgi:hypothetical protein